MVDRVKMEMSKNVTVQEMSINTLDLSQDHSDVKLIIFLIPRKCCFGT